MFVVQKASALYAVILFSALLFVSQSGASQKTHIFAKNSFVTNRKNCGLMLDKLTSALHHFDFFCGFLYSKVGKALH